LDEANALADKIADFADSLIDGVDADVVLLDADTDNEIEVSDRREF
jgi:ABC-type sulfate transport system substrate-binding protein